MSREQELEKEILSQKERILKLEELNRIYKETIEVQDQSIKILREQIQMIVKVSTGIVSALERALNKGN